MRSWSTAGPQFVKGEGRKEKGKKRRGGVGGETRIIWVKEDEITIARDPSRFKILSRSCDFNAWLIQYKEWSHASAHVQTHYIGTTTSSNLWLAVFYSLSSTTLPTTFSYLKEK